MQDDYVSASPGKYGNHQLLESWVIPTVCCVLLCIFQSPYCVRYVPSCHHKEEEGRRFAGACCVEGSGL